MTERPPAFIINLQRGTPRSPQTFPTIIYLGHVAQLDSLDDIPLRLVTVPPFGDVWIFDYTRSVRMPAGLILAPHVISPNVVQWYDGSIAGGEPYFQVIVTGRPPRIESESGF